MYISHMIASKKIGFPLVFSLELSSEQWKREMGCYRLDSNEITINDSTYTILEMKKCIEQHLPSIVFIHHVELVDDKEMIQNLKSLAKEFSIPVVVTLCLSRSSGNNDPVYRRPQLLDLITPYMWLYGQNRTISEFWRDIHTFNSIMLLHICHDWYRNIGTGYAFNICNEAELSIIRWGFFHPEHVFLIIQRFLTM